MHCPYSWSLFLYRAVLVVTNYVYARICTYIHTYLHTPTQLRRGDTVILAAGRITHHSGHVAVSACNNKHKCTYTHTFILTYTHTASTWWYCGWYSHSRGRNVSRITSGRVEQFACDNKHDHTYEWTYIHIFYTHQRSFDVVIQSSWRQARIAGRSGHVALSWQFPTWRSRARV